MGTRKESREVDDFDDDDDNLIDDEPDDGFSLLDDDSLTKPEDRRRDPLRKPL